MDYVIKILPFLMEGLKWTFKIYLITIVVALPLSIILAIGKVSMPKFIKAILNFYTWVWRGTPLMLQLFFIYFALPSLGVSLDVFVAVAIGYILNMAAYETEIIRSGIESIEKGQYEAAKALGMTYRQTMQKVILPQIIRRVLPATCSETIILLKDTSLASVVGVGELLRNTKELFNLDINIIVFFVTFLIYLFLSSILVQLFSHLEKKYSIYE